MLNGEALDNRIHETQVMYWRDLIQYKRVYREDGELKSRKAVLYKKFKGKL